MWNLRNTTSEQRERERKRQRHGEREKPRNRLFTIENKWIITRGKEGEGMGEIGEGD